MESFLKVFDYRPRCKMQHNRDSTPNIESFVVTGEEGEKLGSTSLPVYPLARQSRKYHPQPFQLLRQWAPDKSCMVIYEHMTAYRGAAVGGLVQGNDQVLFVLPMAFNAEHDCI